jgi:hypothetical protein
MLTDGSRTKSEGKSPGQLKTEYMLNYSSTCSCSWNLSSFWLILKQQWTIEEIAIFSNSSHLEWRAELSDTILKGTHPGTTPARFGLNWFSGFRGEDLNVIFYQSMPNLHNQYKSADRKWINKYYEKQYIDFKNFYFYITMYNVEIYPSYKKN